MPIRRNAVPVASRVSSVLAASNSRSGSTVGLGRRDGAGADGEIRRLQLQHDAAGGQLVLLQPAGQLLRQPPEMRLQVGGPRQVGIEGGLGADRLGLARRIDPAHVLAAGACGERRAIVAQPAARLAVAQRLEVAEQRDALGGEPAGQRGADAGQQADRLRRQQRRGLPGADHREAARLVAAGGDLGQQPVGGQADRHGDADARFHLAREAGQHDGGRRAVQRLGAGEVEHRLVDRQRLQQRREPRHHGADLPARPRRIWRSRGGSPRRRDRPSAP